MNSLKSILLAEDNELDVEMTMRALAAHNLANEVQIVRDGAEALDYLHCRAQWAERTPGHPLLILLDNKMPKMSGLDVLEHVRKDDQLRRIPIVMLTSSREEGDLLRSYDLGVNAYVVKPVDFREFVGAMKQLSLFWALINTPPPGSARPR